MPTSKAARFRALHDSGCFVIPNPWDAGSARYLEHLGFPALATTSGGFAFTRALADEDLPCAAALDNIRAIVSAVAVPVSADFQAGYGASPDQVASNVAQCVATGAAGLSIEDASGDARAPLYAAQVALERVRAARRAIDDVDAEVVLTARCEAFLVGAPAPLPLVLDRLVAYADAGADCLYAPGVHDPLDIAAIVRAVQPKAVNVIVTSAAHGSLAQLADLGVRRISVGSALARVAWTAFTRAASELARGSFEPLADTTPYGELNGFFKRRSGA